MRILLDHCVPKRFGRLLIGHEVRTTFDMGWAALTNGVLLSRCSESFDVFLTVDQNLQFQQNLAALPVPVIILVTSDNRLPTLEPFAPAVIRVLEQPIVRELIRIETVDRIVRLPSRHLPP